MLTLAEGEERLIEVTPHAAGFGAEIRGVDLSKPLPAPVMAQVRQAWIDHQVAYFPDQPLTLEELEAFTLAMGGFGHDPFVAPMPGHANILELRREPDEKATNFGAGWHSDWSFQAAPPAATILHAKVVPPVGGDTLYTDAYRAYDTLSETMKTMLAPLNAVHSASRAYGPTGSFAKETEKRTMQIIVSPDADRTTLHPVITTHPESGRKALFVNPVYTQAIDGLTADESAALLGFLLKHVTQEAFVYRHHWAPNMLTMWDNRCTAHMALGGYDGHLRLMHRTTVAGTAPAR